MEEWRAIGPSTGGKFLKKIDALASSGLPSFWVSGLLCQLLRFLLKFSSWYLLSEFSFNSKRLNFFFNYNSSLISNLSVTFFFSLCKEKKKVTKKEEKPGRSWSRSPSRDIFKSRIEGNSPKCCNTFWWYKILEVRRTKVKWLKYLNLTFYI